MNDKVPRRRAWRTDNEWARLRERITASERDRRSPWLATRVRWIAAAAAVMVVAAGLSWRLLPLRSPSLETPVDRVVTTGIGERRTIRLADSSVVTVGPVSTIRYSTGAGSRSVTLDGIADFNVVHDSTRPFRVRAKNAVVTDVGTEFVVRAYAADSGVDVSVTAGVVAMSGGRADSLELIAGQVAFVSPDGRIERRPSHSAQMLSAWVGGRLVFDDVPLATVVTELSRWFDVEIRIPDKQVAQLHLSAGYSTPTLAGVLGAIAEILPVRYERAGNVVTIRAAHR